MENYRQNIEEIKEVYLKERVENNTPFLISFSGGKDSTALLILFFEALLELPEEYRKMKNYLLFADTEMELPYYTIYAKKTLEKIKKFAEENSINIEIDTVTPELKNKFFNLIIGKGQLLPRSDFRWCTQRMKTKPMGDFLKNKFSSNKVISVNGARKEESENRKASLEKFSIAGKKLKTPTKENSVWQKYGFSPLEDLGLRDVWYIIKHSKQSWVDFNAIQDIYRLGTDPNTEIDEYSLEARYGCWLCPVVSRDRTLENAIKNTNSSLFKDMLNFREFILQFKNGWMYSREFPLRDIYNHRYQRLNFINLKNIREQRKGMVSPGGYTLFMRQMFFNELIDLIDRHKDELDPEYILTKEDIKYIQECWLYEGDTDLTAFTISKRIESYIDLELNEEPKRIKRFFDIVTSLEPQTNLNEKRITIQTILRFFKEKYGSILNVENVDYDSIEVVDEFIKEELNIISQLESEGFYFGDTREDYIRSELIYREWHDDKIGFFKFLEKYKNKEIEVPEELERLKRIYAEKDKNLFYALEAEEIEKKFKNYPFLNWIKVLSKIEFDKQNKNGIDILNYEEIPLEEKVSYIEGIRPI